MTQNTSADPEQVKTALKGDEWSTSCDAPGQYRHHPTSSGRRPALVSATNGHADVRDGDLTPFACRRCAQL